jgi:hypothetical protein
VGLERRLVVVQLVEQVVVRVGVVPEDVEAPAARFVAEGGGGVGLDGGQELPGPCPA